MSEQQIVERRKGERRKDVESARRYLGMERRHHERRRQVINQDWVGDKLRTSTPSP